MSRGGLPRAVLTAIAAMAAPITRGRESVQKVIDELLYPAGIGSDSGRGAGRVPGQSIKWGPRSKNAPAFQGQRECARRLRNPPGCWYAVHRGFTAAQRKESQ